MISFERIVHTLKEAEEVVLSAKAIHEIGRRIRSQLKRMTTGKKGRYLLDLQQKLAAMPFIYTDQEGVLPSDYVSVRLRPVDLLALGEKYKRSKVRERERGRHDQVDAAVRLREERCGLILADSGMGKTTWLQQFAITLTLDTETPTINELFGKNKPLPIFVPLKILDNATPRPILTYIRSLPLFSGSQGFRRLIHLASRGELLFLVDGYDEIYIPAEDGPSIKAEIDSLFSGKLEEVQGDQTPLPELTQFYRSLYKNRVWLSTRREYYLLNRLRLDEEETTRFVYPPIAAVEILGLGLESRNQLVKKIFDKYRAKSLVLNEKLSEDEFFLFLSRTHTDETTSLFENPLFLTVMCYLYTKTVENGNLDPSHPTLNLRSLIIQCLRVLLKDLDTYRVRNLPRRIVNALMEKRGLYSDKKLDFLRFLAARSLSDRRYLERSALDEEEIRALAREYFTSMSRDNEVDEILRNLESKDVANNLVRQLILQGVFVLVDRTDAGEFFDFPHSSFRYILALEYFEKYEFNCALIHLDYLAKRDFVITMFQL